MEVEWKYFHGKWHRIPHLKIENAIFQHGGENFTLRDFYDAYKDDLPQIVIATQGYDGGIEMDTIGMGQVMRIHSVCKQRRLIARDSSGRNITIPLNYRLPFRVCTARIKRRQGQLLSDILSTHSLPVQVEFAVSDECRFDVGNTETRVKSFGKITVSKMYDEKYYVANCIYQGILEPRTILIPLCLQNVLVSVVTGIQDMTQKLYQQFVRDIEMAAKCISFDGKVGNENIALYKQVDVDTTQGDDIFETQESDRSLTSATDQEEFLTLFPNPIYRKRPLRPSTSRPEKERTDEVPPPLQPRHPVLSHQATSSTHNNRSSDCDYVKEISYVRRGNEDYTGGRKDDYIAKGNGANYVTSDRYVLTKNRNHSDVSKGSLERDVKITSKEDYVTSKSEDNYVRGKAVFKKNREEKAEKRNLTDLTISEVGEVMKALRLGRHIDTFKKESVDGCVLADLNEHILKEEFKFTGTETIKMMKFIRKGHIPH